jgi:gas vesicle protein
MFMNNPNENLLTFCVGALTGAVVALLVAPRSGVETREALRRGAGELASRGGEAVNSVTDRARDYSHRVGDVVGGAREAVRRPGEAVKEAAHAAKAAYQREMKTEMQGEGS